MEIFHSCVFRNSWGWRCVFGLRLQKENARQGGRTVGRVRLCQHQRDPLQEPAADQGQAGAGRLRPLAGVARPRAAHALRRANTGIHRDMTKHAFCAVRFRNLGHFVARSGVGDFIACCQQGLYCVFRSSTLCPFVHRLGNWIRFIYSSSEEQGAVYFFPFHGTWNLFWSRTNNKSNKAAWAKKIWLRRLKQFLLFY